MADLTGSVKVNKLDYGTKTPFKTECIEVDGAQVPAVLAIGTHDIANIPANRVVTNVRIFAEELPTSGGSATLRASVGSNALGSAAIAFASLVAGSFTDVSSSGISVRSTSEQKLKLTVATAAFTKLNIKVFYDYIDMGSVQ